LTKVSQGVLGFHVIIEKPAAGVTSFGGLVLLLELMRVLLTKKEYRRLAGALGYGAWRTARRHFESLVLLLAGGGEALSDIDVLRGDPGLSKLLGFKPSSATQLKDFLYHFHQDEHGKKLGSKADGELAVKGEARIRPEGPGLVVLGDILTEATRKLQAVHQRLTATMDVDATIIEGNKQFALKTYEGMKGYQPQAAFWAEQGTFTKDEYRDGNVPAAYRAVDFVKKMFASLPGSITKRRLRADSALYDEETLTWLGDVARIDFVVSADMSPELKREVRKLREEDWKPYRSNSAKAREEARLKARKEGRLKDDESAEAEAEERQWAEVCFVPGWKRNLKKNTEAKPFRYIAIRVRSRQMEMVETAQGELIPSPPAWKHFAVVSNMEDWEGERLLNWHREKQGTVEFGHQLVKNGLAARVPPTGQFGANAAFYRFTLLTLTYIRLLQVKALPADMQNAEPKTLRFRIFRLAGRVVQTGRRLVLKLAESLPGAPIVLNARRAILMLRAELAALPG
jgi:hypothetical protein